MSIQAVVETAISVGDLEAAGGSTGASSACERSATILADASSCELMIPASCGFRPAHDPERRRASASWSHGARSFRPGC
jgi:hypothetical protein